MNFLTLILLLSLPLYREPIKSTVPKIETDLVWVYFTDKGFTTEKEYERALSVFSPKMAPDAVERRIRNKGFPADFYDLPVYQKYLDEMQAVGCNLRSVSNWLNAASFRMPKDLLPKIYSLPFVYDVKPVFIHKREVIKTTHKLRTTKSAIRKVHGLERMEPTKKEDTIEYRRLYGPALEQNAMLGIPQVYSRGFFGSKVKIGFLDTGLKKKNQALSHLDTTVVLEHDFLAGDDFFYTQQLNAPVPGVISSLTNIPRVKEPILTYSEVPSETLFLFYIADSYYSPDTFPRRNLYASHSIDGGITWSKPLSLSPVTFGLACRFPSAVSGSGRTYVAWQASPAPNEEQGKIYLGYFIDTIWQNIGLLNQGKSPHLFLKGDSLYLVYNESDSKISFRRGIIYPDSVHWESKVDVGFLPEIITYPQVLLDSLNEIEVFATGLKSGKIYHFRSIDGIEPFESQPEPVNNSASAAKTYIKGNRIHLFYKDYSVRPLAAITYKYSTDGGLTWSSSISVTDTVFSLGAFSFVTRDKYYLGYESGGNIYLAQSNDGQIWTKITIEAREFHYCPLFAQSQDNLSLVWFRRGDDNTDYESDEDNQVQADHGTHMVSIVAGYKRSEIVGVAPAADILMAKTEFHRTKSGNQGRGQAYEFTLEEDTWIEGLEWAERNGAQIISSSLGYRSWYGEAKLDGRTAPISIAAGLAAERGLIIVTAMGNRGQDSTNYPWPTPYIVAPGDAFGVITAGGVHRNRSPWHGSGTGPTIDGRIKPELVAMSDTVIVVIPDSADGIEGSAGTSDATALIAGCCALILEAHPDWNADSVKQALFLTASDNSPGFDTIIDGDTINILGYGIPNVDSVLKIYPPKSDSHTSDQLLAPYPNPFIIGSENDKIYFPLFLANPSRIKPRLIIYTLSGEVLFDTLLNPILRPGRYGTDGDREELEQIGAVWNGKNQKGKPVGSGLYFAVFITGFAKDVKKFAIVR